MQNNTLLTVSDLTKIYYPGKIGQWFYNQKPFYAVDSISFSVGKGEILGILGPNGAGKTTTVQMLLGLLKPSSGSITYFSKNFLKHRSEILHHVGFASTYTDLPGKLTIAENLSIFGRLYGLSHVQCAERIKYLLDVFDMWYLRYRQFRNLSAGQKTRVMLAKAFIHNPSIVVLGEPTASLDPDISQEVRSFVLEQQSKYAMSIVFVSHNMAEVTEVCDTVLVMQAGTIIKKGTPAQLAQSVSKIRLHLLVTNAYEKFKQYVIDHQLEFHEEGGQKITIALNEQDIAQFLAAIAQIGVRYSEIFIDKPTLEDYFISIAKRRGFHV